MRALAGLASHLGVMRLITSVMSTQPFPLRTVDDCSVRANSVFDLVEHRTREGERGERAGYDGFALPLGFDAVLSRCVSFLVLLCVLCVVWAVIGGSPYFNYFRSCVLTTVCTSLYFSHRSTTQEYEMSRESVFLTVMAVAVTAGISLLPFWVYDLLHTYAVTH